MQRAKGKKSNVAQPKAQGKPKPQAAGARAAAKPRGTRKATMKTPSDVGKTPVEVETPEGNVTTVSSEAAMDSSSGTA